MLDSKNVKEVLSMLKDKTVQTALIALSIAVLSFMGGRVSVPGCDKATICHDISKDRDKLSRQLVEQRQECQDKKEKALSELRVDLDTDCALSISEATEGSDFDPEIHCPICSARGECN